MARCPGCNEEVHPDISSQCFTCGAFLNTEAAKERWHQRDAKTIARLTSELAAAKESLRWATLEGSFDVLKQIRSYANTRNDRKVLAFLDSLYREYEIALAKAHQE